MQEPYKQSRPLLFPPVSNNKEGGQSAWRRCGDAPWAAGSTKNRIIQKAIGKALK
jgi:hypothetical protein